MWRCLFFVVAVTLWNLPVFAVPQGENTCQGVVKHPVKVKVNVTEPVTFRTYTWCLRVPPRCSKYIVQMRERVKEQIEMHNRTITVCCRGFVEMESKCVPACPPMTECPNMRCNRTNHCHCNPGYSGVFCNDPCPKGSWGKDCKKPCDCPDGFTCHHLTGDCMLDDKPPAKTTVRHSRFTHISSEGFPTKMPLSPTYKPSEKPQTTPVPIKITTKTTTASTKESPSTLPTTTSRPFQVLVQNSYIPTTVFPPKVNENFNPSNFMPSSIEIASSTATPINKTPSLTTFWHNKLPVEREQITSTIKTSVVTTTTPHSITVTKPRLFTWSFILPKEIERSETTTEPSVTISTTSPSFKLLDSSDKSTTPSHRGSQRVITSAAPRRMDNINVFTVHQTTLKPDILESTTLIEKSSVDWKADISPNSKSTIAAVNDNKESVQAVDTSYQNELNTSPKIDRINISTLKSFVYKTPFQSTISPHFLSSAKSTTVPPYITTPSVVLFDHKEKPEHLTTSSSFHNYDSITNPVDNPEISMQTPNRNWNAFIPAPVPTQSHGSLTFPITINTPVTKLSPNNVFNSENRVTDEPLSRLESISRTLYKQIEPSILKPKQPETYADELSTLPSVLKTSKHYSLNSYLKTVGDLSNFKFPVGDYATSKPSFKKSTTPPDIGIFVFPPPKPEKKPSHITATSEKLDDFFSTTPFTPLTELPKHFSETNVDDKNDYFISATKTSLPPAITSSVTPRISPYFSDIQPKVSTSSPSEVQSSTNFPLPTESLNLKKTEEFTTESVTEKQLVPLQIIPHENRKNTVPSFDNSRIVISSSGSFRQETEPHQINPTESKPSDDRLTTKSTTTEPGVIDSVFNVLSKNDFIAIFRPEAELKNNFRQFTIPNRVRSTMKPAISDMHVAITSTYSSNKTAATLLNVPDFIARSKNAINSIGSDNVETSSKYVQSSDKNYDVSATTPLVPFNDGNHNIVVNGKQLEEPSNYLPTVHEQSTVSKNFNEGDMLKQSTIQFAATESSRSGYLPTDKDFINLTYILNSINDFTSNNMKDIKQSPKSYVFGNPNKVKLTEKPQSSDLITNSVYDHKLSTVIEKHISIMPFQKSSKLGNHGSLFSQGKRVINDSKIIHLNISSHLPSHSAPIRVTRKYSTPSAGVSPSSFNPFHRGLSDRAIDGRITTVSFISTVPFFKYPTKRSAKDITLFKTENAFTFKERSDVEENRPTVEPLGTDSHTTVAYSPSLVTPSGVDSLQITESVNDEISKKPFRRKDFSTSVESEDEMTAALAAHSALLEEDSYISLTAVILASVTGVLLVGSLASVFILIFKYCRKDKPVPMESCIMAYELNTSDPLYSVPRPSLLPEIFFCPTFTHNYAAQINKELRELSYSTTQKETSEPVYTEISN